jgi:quinol monooxygenase YgiN
LAKLAIVLEVKTKPGMRGRLRASWDRHLRPQLQDPGSAQSLYLVCEDSSDHDKLVLIEVYDDSSMMEANASQSWFQAYLHEVAPLLDGRPRMTLATPVWAKGLAV